PREAFDDRGQQSRGDDVGTANAQLAGGGIVEELDLLDALTHFVKHGGATSEKSLTVSRRLHPVGRAIEEAHTKGMLEVRDRLGSDGMRDGELDGRFGYAARLGNGEKDVEISQPHAPACPIDPVHAASLLSQMPT